MFNKKENNEVSETKEKKPFYKKMWFKVLAGLFVLSMIVDLLGVDTSPAPTTTETASTEVVTEKQEITETEQVTETEEVTEEVTETEIVYTFNPADYETGITYEDLARFPEENAFSAVKFEGEVNQVLKTEDGVTQLMMLVNGNIDERILAELSEEAITNNDGGNVLEGDYIRVYGTYIMQIDYKTVLGTQKTIPAMVVDRFEFVQ